MNIMFLTATRLPTPHPSLLPLNRKPVSILPDSYSPTCTRCTSHAVRDIHLNTREMCISYSKDNHIPPDIQISFMYRGIMFRTSLLRLLSLINNAACRVFANMLFL
ncbi:hypothetical protein DXD58_08355 [Bacteroides sp. D20]|nr:hypothetical protein DXD58_08355 [Bacteroides sp. D20]